MLSRKVLVSVIQRICALIFPLVEYCVLQMDFSQKTRLRNFPLVVEGQKLWVSRDILAEYSPVFEKMFFGDFQEAQIDIEQIPLPEKKLGDVAEFLRAMHASRFSEDKTIANRKQAFLNRLVNKTAISMAIKKCSKELKFLTA